MKVNTIIRGLTRSVCLSSAMLLICSGASAADPVGHTGTVTRIVIEPGFWGGCAARMVPQITTTAGLEDCNANYVTFDCDATTGITSKAEAQAKNSQAQLAMVSGKDFYVKVDPDVKLNSVCFASRADVKAN